MEQISFSQNWQELLAFLPAGWQSQAKQLGALRRWQIELVFKRLKSLMGLGHLRKTDVEGARAWLHGKLLVAFMLEAMLRAGETFSPWGYPLRTESEHLAGDGVYVAVA